MEGETVATASRRPSPRSLASDGFGQIEDVGKFLKLPTTAVEEMLRSGELPYADFHGSVRVPWRAVLDFSAGKILACINVRNDSPAVAR